ncbi:MAG: anti-sigma regulatory factor [Desulfococcaceae bacterium]|jgi:serine/threonine-protein kinase RsbT|nr:anti-sigma regulatory factor [Desulfococcaceae bacterium]
MMKEIIGLQQQSDIIQARKIGREMAKTLGFGSADQTRLATAISEITRNAIQYGRGGHCVISGYSDRNEKKISISVEDRGPGIPDIDKAMEDGYTTGHGLGAGLPGARRLMHEFHIESGSGGTKVVMGMKQKNF